MMLAFVAVESALLVIAVVPLFFKIIYDLHHEQGDRSISLNISRFLCLLILYPPIFSCALLGFIVQIMYMLYRSAYFYCKILMCKIRWSDAIDFTLLRTITLTGSFCEAMSG